MSLTEPSAALSPPITSSPSPRTATAGSWTGAGKRPARRMLTRGEVVAAGVVDAVGAPCLATGFAVPAGVAADPHAASVRVSAQAVAVQPAHGGHGRTSRRIAANLDRGR